MISVDLYLRVPGRQRESRDYRLLLYSRNYGSLCNVIIEMCAQAGAGSRHDKEFSSCKLHQPTKAWMENVQYPDLIKEQKMLMDQAIKRGDSFEVKRTRCFLSHNNLAHGYTEHNYMYARICSVYMQILLWSSFYK